MHTRGAYGLSGRCDETEAMTYCDGTEIHHTAGGDLEPTLGDIVIGWSITGASPLNPSAEICAVRMTNRALTQEEMAQNQKVDHIRFAPVASRLRLTWLWEIRKGFIISIH